MESYKSLLSEASFTLDMFEHNKFLDFVVNQTFRSIGQIYFCNNPFSGLCFFIASLIEDTTREAACYGLLAVVVGNLGSNVFHLDTEARRNGLFGFNPYLLGAALRIFRKRGQDWTPDLWLMVCVLILPFFAVILQIALNHRMIPHLKCPCFTLPFVICTICFLLEAERPASVFNGLVHPSPMMAAPGAQNESLYHLSLQQFFQGVLNGVSQVITNNKKNHNQQK